MGVPLIWRFNRWALRDGHIVARGRAARMRAFLDLVKPPPKARIIDLGGTELIWNLMGKHDFHVTLVNLPDWKQTVQNPEQFTIFQGDATNLKDSFGDKSFDVAFSNSCIEHVGDESMQEKFAREAQRVGKAYWVQTPSTKFPLEVHTGVPLYWHWPTWAINSLHRRWAKRYPHLLKLITTTRVLSRERMEYLFPGAQFFCERRFGFEKSYAAYRPYQPDPVPPKPELQIFLPKKEGATPAEPTGSNT